MINFSYETEEDVQVETETGDSYVLMLYNDEVNTFDHVIESLVEVCNHEVTQAEQVAWIVHTKGKCDIKHGSLTKLNKMCTQLLNRQLSAVIEQ